MPEGVSIEAVDIWFQDEARVGQRGTLSRIWARVGSRPRLIRQQQNQYAYVLGAICPALGQAVGLVMPHVNTQAMQHHLDEISLSIPPSRHAVIVMDCAAWHTTQKLNLPSNLSLLSLPPTSPELNPVEHVWQWLRQRYWANRTFQGYQAIVEACCTAWNAFASDPEKITSIGTRKWANLNI